MEVKYIKNVLIIAAAFAAAAHADTINGIEFVDIFGGAGDSDSDSNRDGYGAVTYDYKISTYEISYAQFAQSGISDANANEWVGVGTMDSNTAPVVNINFHQAAQYANYLTSGNTGDGAYTLNGSGEVIGVMPRQDIVDSGELYFVLPTEDEWYRAAYNTSGTTDYTLFANGTDTAPLPTEAKYGLTEAGPAWGVADGALESNNGTYNMMGNVWEWLETPSDGAAISNGVVFRGGSYRQTDSRMIAEYQGSGSITGTNPSIGMRIVAIPEPGTISLMGLSTVGLFVTRRIKRRRYLGQSIAPIRKKAPLCDRLDKEQENLQHLHDSDETVFSLLTELIKEKVLSFVGNIYSTYKQADTEFWNHMVVSHERRIARRKVVRQARKEKLLAGFDAFLARIMK